MGCSRRPRKDEIRPEQKWDFISLQDFKSTSCIEPLAYAYLWISLFISVAVYGVDTFTAVNLLAFSKFTSIQPAISLNISKWIFAVCIILSWINVGYEHWRAYGVMKRGAVAESYLDSLAVRLQAIRIGKKGQGWRRFLVFAELTKSKKGAEYVALFTYFGFQSWIRVIFCSGPRQVVNALTLLAVYQAHLNPNDSDAATSILKFFKNIEILAQENYRQALILAGMLFTLVIWVFAALSLILALLCYLLFLWHYIPNSDGGLTGYCERKINGRLNKIVGAKVQKALEEDERKQRKAEQRAARKGEKPPMGRQATVPTMFDANDDDKLPDMPMINRNDTMSTLPKYTSRPGTPSSQQPTIPDVELSNLDPKRPYPLRTGTSASTMSNTSYASNAPLIGGASEMGYGRSESPAPSVPSFDPDAFPFPQRSMTANSNGSQWQRGTPQPLRNGPPSRQMTQDYFGDGTTSPLSRLEDSHSMNPSRQDPEDSFAGESTKSETQVRDDDSAGHSRKTTQDSQSSHSQGPPSRDEDGFPRAPSRQATKDSFSSNPRSPPFDNLDTAAPRPVRQATQDSFSSSRSPPFDNLGDAPPRPIRQTTQDSYSSNSRQPQNRPEVDYPVRSRQMTQDSYASNSRGPNRRPENENSGGPRQMTQESYPSTSRGPPSRQMTQDTYVSSPVSYADSRNNARPPPPSTDNSGRSLYRPDGTMERRPPFDGSSNGGRASPAPGPYGGSQSGQGNPRQVQRSNTGMNDQLPPAGYGPPPRSASAGVQGPSASFQRQQPYRNMTEPVANGASVDGYFAGAQYQRQGPPQNQRDYQTQHAPYNSSNNDRSQRGPSSRGGPGYYQGQQGGYRR